MVAYPTYISRTYVHPFTFFLGISLLIHLLVFMTLFLYPKSPPHPPYTMLHIQLGDAPYASLDITGENNKEEKAGVRHHTSSHPGYPASSPPIPVLKPAYPSYKKAAQGILPGYPVATAFSSPHSTRHTQGSMLGNTLDPEASTTFTYEQKLALWLNRFRTYPAQAKMLKLEGTGEIGIYIDRQGNVLDLKIVKSTGHPILDNALVTMVKDASPVVPIPAHYQKNKKTFFFYIQFPFLAAGNT